jgi:hypothetical protein
MYSTLKFIKSKYHSVLTYKHFAELVRTALIKQHIVLKTRVLLKVPCVSRTSDARGGHPLCYSIHV